MGLFLVGKTAKRKLLESSAENLGPKAQTPFVSTRAAISVASSSVIMDAKGNSPPAKKSKIFLISNLQSEVCDCHRRDCGFISRKQGMAEFRKWQSSND
jgi:hypothetical protein